MNFAESSETSLDKACTHGFYLQNFDMPNVPVVLRRIQAAARTTVGNYRSRPTVRDAHKSAMGAQGPKRAAGNTCSACHARRVN